MRPLKIILAAAIILLAVRPATTYAFDQSISSQNPKIANTFLQWTISDSEAAALAHWDVLILDMENQVNNPQEIRKIRALHPGIIILAYVSSQEIRNDVAIHPELSLRKKLFSQIPDSWYLRDASNRKISFWPDTWTLNLSDDAPFVNGRRFNDYLPQFIKYEILSSGLWDGVFYDNLWDSIDWLNQGKVDINNDGQNDSAAVLDQKWQAGVLEMLSKTRQLVGYDYILMANSSSFPDYQKYLNGRLYENFPLLGDGSGTWESVIADYQNLAKINVSPQIYIVNSTENSQADYAKMRYGLASCLLFDNLYFSFDRSVNDHNQGWWYDEYNFSLGLPKAPAYRTALGGSADSAPASAADSVSSSTPAAVWRRDFQNGSVFLNNGSEPALIDVGGDNLKYLAGGQDQKVNSGQAAKEIYLPARDGVILEKNWPLPGAYLKNGYSYGVYDAQGRVIHSPLGINVPGYKKGDLLKYDNKGKIVKAKVRPLKTSLRLPKGLSWANKSTAYDVVSYDINHDGLPEYLIAKN